MNILCISGSARTGSSNQKLLNYIGDHFGEHQFNSLRYLHKLPLFHADIEDLKTADLINLRHTILAADAIIISTPEYIHGIPASLKNALEWLTKTGELTHKKLLAIVYTPSAPRGDKALSTLIHSLQALNANVIGSLLLHHTDISFDDEGKMLEKSGIELLETAINQLTC